MISAQAGFSSATLDRSLISFLKVKTKKKTFYLMSLMLMPGFSLYLFMQTLMKVTR